MNDPSYRPNVDLREYIEAQIEALDARVMQRFELQDQAMRLQAIEYERRLTELNHAHARAVTEQARVLPREVHELYQRDIGRELRTINDRLMKIENRYSNFDGRMVVVVAVVATLMSALIAWVTH